MLKECEGDGAGQFVPSGPEAGGGLNPSSTSSRFVPPAVLFSGRKKKSCGFPAPRGRHRTHRQPGR